MNQTVADVCSSGERELEALLLQVPAWQGKDITYLPTFGGFSNSSWKVTVGEDEKSFFVKMPGPGTENFIDRIASLEASQRAHLLGIGPRSYDYLAHKGVEICDFVEGSRACALRDFHVADVRNRIIDLYRKFNDSAPLQLTKTVFDMIEEHISQLHQLGGTFPHDFQSLHRHCEQARQALEASGQDIVPCHNDPAPANFLIDDSNGAITIVDFEYASNNDRCYDIATWCGEIFLNGRQQNEAIEHYFGTVRPDIQARMIIYRALADFKWSLWAQIQMNISTIDFDFCKVSMWKLMRLRSGLRNPRWSQALASL